MHTLLDLRGNIPSFIQITEAKVSDVNILDELLPEPGAFYVKAFFGTSENAVKTQIWIAVSVYVLVAIIRKRLGLEATLYEILQILSLTLFEKQPILQVLGASSSHSDSFVAANQLNLFAF